MRIGITGATGQLGRIIVEKLKTKVPATDIVAIVRTPARAAKLGIAARGADYTDRGALERALAQIDTLLLISSSEIGQREAHHRNVIDAAKNNGVRWILYTSILRADTSPINLAAEHSATEADIRASGIPFTILRNGWYTENYTGSIPGALAAGALIGCADDGKISSAARADYAEAAVVALTTDGHIGKTYELAGDEAWTLRDLAAEISRQAGRTIPYRNLTEGEYAATLQSFGVPAPMARNIAHWDTAAAQGALFDEGHALSGLIGHRTTPMAETVGQAVRQAA